jgi:hypothetical protein
LLLDHIFDLSVPLLLILVELEPLSLNVPVPYLSCLPFLYLRQECLAQFDQILGRIGLCHLQGLQEINGVLFFSRSYEGDGCSLVASSSCTPDSMNVVFKVVWAFKVDNQYYRRDIESPGAHTGGYHYVDHFLFEVVDSEFPVVRIHGSMEHQSTIAILKKLLKQIVGLCLLINKDKYTSFVVPVPQKL